MNLTRVLALYRSILDAYIIVRPQRRGRGASDGVVGWVPTTEDLEPVFDLLYEFQSVQERLKTGVIPPFFLIFF